MITPGVFADKLFSMSENIARNLPWSVTKDPYKIWLSEIILQQTKVAQGLAYYERFIEDFPTVVHLAEAPLDHVLKLWEGLGYYSRARNLHASAQIIVEKHGAKFPEKYEDILSLKGIGPYTASAIASFAYGQHFAAIDGNAMRVISRVLGITGGIDTNEVIKQINDFGKRAILNSDPATFNQTMMDVGSQICTPKQPKCNDCTFYDLCVARIDELTSIIPFKTKKVQVTNRHFHYFFITDGNHVVINQRNDKDIWKGLYQLPLIESDSDIFELDQLRTEYGIKHTKNISLSSNYLHILTHQRIQTYFYIVKVDDLSKINKDQNLVERKKVSNFAFPRVITRFFEEKSKELSDLLY